MGLLNKHFMFDMFTKRIYAVFATLLAFSAIVLIFYSIHIFVTDVILVEKHDHTVFTNLFEGIISLTLGIAIFDLAKTLFNHEVFEKVSFTGHHVVSNVLRKFMTSIIIAMSIEALLLVFKISIDDFSNMIHAVILIFGIFLLLVGISIYSKMENLNKKG